MASETSQRRARLFSPLAALAGERKCDHSDNQGAGFLRLLSDDRRSPGARATAQASAKNDQLRSRAGLGDIASTFPGGRLADGRIATRTQARRGLATELHFVRGRGTKQSLRIRMHGHAFRENGALPGKVLDDGQTRATDADDLDRRDRRDRCGQLAAGAHGNHIPGMNLPILRRRRSMMEMSSKASCAACA